MVRDSMNGLVRAGRRLATAFAWLCLAGIAPLAYGQATPQYTNFCFGCHSATPSGPRLNAANASAVITAANTNHGMGLGAAALAQIGTIATEIAQFLSGTTTASVNYQSSGNSIPINDLFVDDPGAVVTTTQTVVAPSRGTITHIASSVSPTYSHTAANCLTDNFSVRGIGSANTATRQVSITINPPAAPTSANATFNIAYNTGATGLDVNPFVSGTTPTGTISLGAISPNVGSVAATGTMTFNYTASASAYAPTVTGSYQVSGPCSTTSISRTITINVGAPPAPVGVNVGPIQRPAATQSTVDLSASITGIQDTTPAAPAGTYVLSVTQPTAPGSGSVAVNPGTNVVTYTPSGTFTGTTTFTYQRSGPGGTSVARTVTLDVTSAPVGTDSSTGPTPFNTPINFDVAPLIAGTFTTVNSGPAAINGTSSVAGTVVTYTPTPGFFGSGGFTYTATGPGGTSTPNTVTIQVLPPPPTANNGNAVATYQTATPIDVAPFIVGVTSAPPVSAFTPVNGTITSVVGTVVTFLPAPGFTGAASFQYNATGPGGTSANATVNITVNPPPAPTATGGTFLVSATTPTTVDLSTLITGFASSVQITTTPLFGTIAVNGLMITYTPVQSAAVTSVTFQYRAVGPGGNSTPATVTLDYTNAPVTPNRTFSIPFNTPTTLDLMERTAGVVTTLNIVTQPANGLVLVRGNVITYTPNTGYFGPDSFTYSAAGPGGTSTPGTVSLTVNPPVGQPQNATVNVPFNTPTTINFADLIRGVATTVAITTAPQNGTIVINGTTGVYTPAPGYFGPDTFQYAAVNGAGTSEPATITINVGSVKPLAGAATMTVPLNTSGSKDLAPFISGSGVQGVSIPKQATHGTVTVNGTIVTYTPKHNFFGVDTFQYLAFGNLGASDAPGTVTVTVTGRPDPSADPDVRGLVEAQAATPGRFSRAQIGNIQRRMETLHRGPDSAFPEAPPKAPKAPAEGAGTAPSSSAPAPSPNARAAFTPPGSTPTAREAQANAQQAAGAMAGISDNPLVSSLISLAASQSVSLNGASTLRDGTSVWMGGVAQFGDIEGNGERSGMRFSTDGVTFGADRRLNDRLAVGIAAGYARDETRIGTDGSRSKARGTSFGVYSSYQPTPNTFVDALAGVGKIDFDSTRWVEPFDAFATAGRKADQFFGSVAAGYEWRRDGVLISPYGRLDVSRDKLKGVTESGAEQYNLRFADQTLRSTQLGAGIRAEAQHEMEFGRVVPKARIEYRREFQDGGSARVSYADLLGGPEYSITTSGVSRNSLLFGVGTEFLLSGGLKLGVDYQAERAAGAKNTQAYRLFVSQDLDFKGLPPFRFGTDMLEKPISIDFGFTHDNNVGRGRLSEEKKQDSITSLGVGQEWIQPLNTNLRLVATPLITAEKFRRFAGLGRFSGGIQGELQYRGSAAFDATTFGLRGSAVWDQYESRLRTGSRYFLGVNARRALTDRIDLFGEVGGNARFGRSEVFELRDVAAKGNVDYSLGRNGTVYFSGEFRRGDTFSSGFGSLTNLALADVFVADDAFDDGSFAYRIEARTILGTLGYNRPLGPRDSIDFSWRRVQSTPTNKPGFETGSLRYNDNQYSIVYLLRF